MDVFKRTLDIVMGNIRVRKVETLARRPQQCCKPGVGRPGVTLYFSVVHERRMRMIFKCLNSWGKKSLNS